MAAGIADPWRDSVKLWAGSWPGIQVAAWVSVDLSRGLTWIRLSRVGALEDAGPAKLTVELSAANGLSLRRSNAGGHGDQRTRLGFEFKLETVNGSAV